MKVGVFIWLHDPTNGFINTLKDYVLIYKCIKRLRVVPDIEGFTYVNYDAGLNETMIISYCMTMFMYTSWRTTFRYVYVLKDYVSYLVSKDSHDLYIYWITLPFDIELTLGSPYSLIIDYYKYESQTPKNRDFE